MYQDTHIHIGRNRHELLHMSTRQKHRCIFCKEIMTPSEDRLIRPNSITKEHIHPRSRGGTNHGKNLAASCFRCNSLRGNIHVKLFRLIVRNLRQHELLRKMWHSEELVESKLLVRLVRWELLRAHAFVSRRAAFELYEKHPMYTH